MNMYSQSEKMLQIELNYLMFNIHDFIWNILERFPSLTESYTLNAHSTSMAIYGHLM